MFVAPACNRVAAAAAAAAVNRTSYRRYVSLWSKVQSAAKMLVGRKEDNPRQKQERKDLSMVLLASTHLRLRNEIPEKTVEELIDSAIEILEKRGMDDQSIVGLRYELQCVLAPELCSLFETFQYVDDRLKKDGIMGDVEDNSLEEKENQAFETMLLQEHEGTTELINCDHGTTKNRSDPNTFLHKKCGALKLLQSNLKGRSVAPDAGDSDDKDFDSLLDDFGYNPNNADDETNQAIRYHQALNLCRSALIRNELDYSTISLKSTIPGAGRGVFVDGKAKAGSILAFFPGDSWPKEYLTGASTAMTDYFSQDDNFQLSLRYDDIAIDSRKSPYTVLNNDTSNPWSIAHICNHPPAGVPPNCRTVMLNFTENMKLGSSDLERYVPNSYARKPMIMGAKALDRDVIAMHGMGLIAARDVSQEELFYDYRLSRVPGKSHPDWYHEVEPDETASRWWSG